MRIEIQEFELLFVLIIYSKYKGNRMEIDGVSIHLNKTDLEIVHSITSFDKYKKDANYTEVGRAYIINLIIYASCII